MKDATSTRRDEYFTTDPDRTPSAVISHYCGRWNIETTFQEALWFGNDAWVAGEDRIACPLGLWLSPSCSHALSASKR